MLSHLYGDRVSAANQVSTPMVKFITFLGDGSYGDLGSFNISIVGLKGFELYRATI